MDKTELNERTEVIINREIYVNQSSLVSTLIENNIVEYEEIANLCETDEDGNETDKEVFEWYCVSNWLGEHLKEYGEVVLVSYGQAWWGRTCTGQAIILDGTIQAVLERIG